MLKTYDVLMTIKPIKKYVLCWKCDASGYIHEDYKTKQCPICKGKGEIPDDKPIPLV
jgi:rubrerythrin